MSLVKALQDHGSSDFTDVDLKSAETFEKNWIGPRLLRDKRQVIEGFTEPAKKCGLTVVIDGRKNAARKSMEAMIVECIHGFALLKNRCPPPGLKKDATWVTAYLRENLINFEDAGDFKDLLKYTVALVTDNAKASVNASQDLELLCGIFSVRCQLQSLNGLLVHIFDEIQSLKWLQEQTKVFFTAFMDIHRMREYIEHKSQKVVFRFVDTRMIFTPVVYARLAEMKASVKDALLIPSFSDLLRESDSTTAEKSKVLKAVAVVRDNRFWALVEFASTAFLPVTLLARELDKGIPNAPLAIWGWYYLSKFLHEHLSTFTYTDEEFDTPVKVINDHEMDLIKTIVAQDMNKYTTPILNAAFFLFPGFHELREDLKVKDRELYFGLKKDVMAVFKTLLRRFPNAPEDGQCGSSFDPIATDNPKLKQLSVKLDEYLAQSGDFTDVD